MKKRTQLKKLIDNPIFSFIIGLTLIHSFLSEVSPDLLEILKVSWLESHHGVGVFGFLHVLKAMLDLSEGKERLRRAFRGQGH